MIFPATALEPRAPPPEPAPPPKARKPEPAPRPPLNQAAPRLRSLPTFASLKVGTPSVEVLWVSMICLRTLGS